MAEARCTAGQLALKGDTILERSSGTICGECWVADRKVEGGLATGILLVPQVFGWMVLRSGYGFTTRLLVLTYMVLSTIPLYFLIVTLWSSGGDIFGMARDFDRNREVTARGVDEARQYIDEYEKGDPAGTHAGDSKVIVDTRPVAMTALRLAQEAERGEQALAALKGRSIEISGPAAADGRDGIVYLEGTDTYPAVTLRLADERVTVAAGQQVNLVCDGLTLVTAGPKLVNCQ